MKKISKAYLQTFSIVLIFVVFASSHLTTLKLNQEANFSSNIDFNQENVVTDLSTSSSASDYDYKWNRTWGGIYDDYIDSDNAMAIDSSNNIYVVGRIDTTGTGNNNIVLIKCNSQGVEQWVKIWDGGASDTGHSIFIDNSNEIYVVGMTTSYADPDGDMVIIKYDSNGNQQWNFTWGGTELDNARVIVKDSSNNFYIAGETRSFGEVDGDAILVKFDSNWIEQWSVTWGGADRDYANAMEIDSLGYICVVGGSYSSDPSTGEADVMILKYDTSGTLIWARDWGTSWTQRGPAIAIDSNDNIYFVGHTFGNPSSSMMGHLVNYDTNGNYQWERIWGVSGVYGNTWAGVIIDSNDEIFIIGGTSTHGPYTGSQDVILFNYDTTGNQNWYKTWGMPGNDRAMCLNFDSQNNLFVAGWLDSLGAGGYDIFLMKYLNTLEPEISIITPENKTYTKPDSGYYPATYGFEDELGQTYGSDIRFIDEYQGYSQSWYCLIKSVEGNRSGHMDTMVVGDAQGGRYTWGVHNFDDPQSTGTIEFYLSSGGGGLFSALERQDLQFRSSDNTIAFRIIIQLHDDKIVYYDGSDWQEITTVIDEEWYHHSISFNCEAGIKGQFTWIITDSQRNEVGRVENIEFENDLSTVDEMYFGSRESDYGYGGTWWDAFGFSWDPNYNIGDNLNEGLLLSYENTTNLDWQGYSLDGQEYVTIYGNYTIPVPVNGAHTIQVFGTDSIGTSYESSIRHFTCGTTSVPKITIISPTPDQFFNNDAPDFEISIFSSSINATWYTIDDGVTNITFSGLTGTIDQTEWDKNGDGDINLRFYANNTLGNSSYSDVTIKKDTALPLITIDSPLGNELFGKPAPNFNITIIEPNIDLMWYTLDYGATNITHVLFNGTINQSEWNKMGNGTVDIRFYVLDKAGNAAYADITVRKDIIDPIVIINNPLGYEVFGFQPPQYDVSVIEPNIDSTWYSLGDGITNISFTGSTGTIDQVEWDKLSNGTVIITFYANDTTGNVAQASVTVCKDILAPIISVNSPQNDQVFGFNAPSYDLSIQEGNLDKIWYSFDGGVTNFPLYSLTGTIDQVEWDNIPEGFVTIRFYANDSLGHESFGDAIVVKDLTAPIITISSYLTNNIFGDFAPDYTISITEENLLSYWYTMDNGATNISISSFEGSLNEFEWDKHGNGTFIITFYAEDEAGNVGFASALIRKDIIAPIITIDSPNGFELFGTEPPEFDLSILEANLESTWYSLDGGFTTFSFTGLSGIINSAEWNKYSNGTVTITFSAMDSSWSQNYAEVSITVRKDILAPIIIVNSPEYDEVFGFNAPNYDLSIQEGNLDKFWYSFDGGVTTLPLYSLTGTLDQAEWDKIPEGLVIIQFYANDSLGHESFSDAVVVKDLTAPVITINSPLANQIYGDFAPDYSISITEENLLSYWYTMNSGATNFSISSFEGSLNEFEWDKHGNGTFIITFYAKDEVGNIGYASVLIRKDIIAPIITINSPVEFELFGTEPPEFDLLILEANLDAVWYSLDGGVTVYPFTGLSGIIDSTEWNIYSNGTVTITFSARDSSLSQNYAEVSITVCKDVQLEQLIRQNGIKGEAEILPLGSMQMIR